MSSWRDSTQREYDLYIRQWLSFCSERHVSVTSPPLGSVIEFLTALFHKGLSYSALNTARSALSSFIMVGDRLAGQHPLVTRFMKGIFNKRPCFPKTCNMGHKSSAELPAKPDTQSCDVNSIADWSTNTKCAFVEHSKYDCNCEILEI